MSEFKQDSVVYISGPISGLESVPINEKLERFHRAEDWLINQEWVAKTINPLQSGNSNCSPMLVGNRRACNPTGQRGQDGLASHSWECYMKHDLRDLMLCDAIAMLPGWRSSQGASLERFLALKLKYKVLYLNEQGVVPDVE